MVQILGVSPGADIFYPRNSRSPSHLLPARFCLSVRGLPEQSAHSPFLVCSYTAYGRRSETTSQEEGVSVRSLFAGYLCSSVLLYVVCLLLSSVLPISRACPLSGLAGPDSGHWTASPAGDGGLWTPRLASAVRCQMGSQSMTSGGHCQYRWWTGIVLLFGLPAGPCRRPNFSRL